MKRLALVCVLMLVALFSGCDDNAPNFMNLYIEKPVRTDDVGDNYYFVLREVRCQQSYYATEKEVNIFNDQVETKLINGYEYYMFSVPLNTNIVSVVVDSYYWKSDKNGTEDGPRESYVHVDLKNYDWARLDLNRIGADGYNFHNGYTYDVVQGKGEIR